MKPILTLLVMLLASACTNGIQTSSGSTYLANYDASTTKASRSTNKFDEDLRRAAGVDPILKLPGKIGVARIVNGQLSNVPEGEVALLTQLQNRHRKFGEFVPVNPLIARATAKEVGNNRYVESTDILRFIRLGAARQHLDAVLVYEIGARGRTKNRILEDVGILSANTFLPPRKTANQAIAQAALIDVRNGYIYATVTSDADVTAIFRKVGAKSDDRRDQAAKTVFTELLPKIDSALTTLTAKLKKR